MRKICLIPVVGALLLLAFPPTIGAAAAQTIPTEPVAASASVTPGSWQVLAAQRILDTPAGLGASAPIQPGAGLDLKVTGTGGIPATGVASVSLTVTVFDPTQNGTVTVYAKGAAKPALFSVTFTANRPVSTLVLVTVGSGGSIVLTNNSGAAIHVAVDTAGYTTTGNPKAAGNWVPVKPAKVIDTLTKLGAPGPLNALTSITPKLIGKSGIPSTGVAAVTMVVTVINPRWDGFLTIRPEGQVASGTTPGGANVNFNKNRNAGNSVIVPVTGTGGVQLFNNSTRAIDLQVDITGYIASGTPDVGSLITPPMTRLLDTRYGTGLPPVAPPGKLDAHSSYTILAAGKAGIPAYGASALLLSVTVNQPTQPGALHVIHNSGDADGTSSVSFAAGQNATNLVLVPISGNGTINLVNDTDGEFNVIADVIGYLQGPPTEAPMSWAAPAATNSGLGSPDLLECPTVTFCIAVDNNGASAKFDGTTWRPAGAAGVGYIAILSCPSSSFCLAANGTGAVTTFNGTTWKAAPSITLTNDGEYPAGISCVSATFCLAATSSGATYRWNGAAWTDSARMTEVFDEYSAVPGPISCASTTFCVDVGSQSVAWVYDGSSWKSNSTNLVYPSPGIDCPVANFCVALDTFYDAANFFGGAWRSWTLSWFTSLLDVTCADSTFCVAVAPDSQVAVWDGVEWTDPAFPLTVDGNAGVVSCPTHQLCVALNGQGQQIIGKR